MSTDSLLFIHSLSLSLPSLFRPLSLFLSVCLPLSRCLCLSLSLSLSLSLPLCVCLSVCLSSLSVILTALSLSVSLSLSRSHFSVSLSLSKSPNYLRSLAFTLFHDLYSRLYIKSRRVGWPELNCN